MMRKMQPREILPKKFKHGLLSKLVIKFTPDFIWQLLVDFCQEFINTRSRKGDLKIFNCWNLLESESGHLVGALIHPLQVKDWRIFIDDVNLRHHSVHSNVWPLSDETRGSPTQLSCCQATLHSHCLKIGSTTLPESLIPSSQNSNE